MCMFVNVCLRVSCVGIRVYVWERGGGGVVNMCVFMYAHLCARVMVFVCVCTSAVYVCVYVCVCMCMYVCVPMCVCMYVHGCFYVCLFCICV